MNLTKNAKNNINALLSMSLNTNYMNIRIDKTDMFEDTFICNFTRKVSINHLQKIKDYFKIDIRDKLIPYSLIVNKNTNTIKLHIEGIENQQLNLFDDTNELLDKIKDYDEKITNRLYNYSEYLYETLYPTDTDLFVWTFYYIAHNKKHIGFANADLQNSRSIKVFVSDFDWFKNDDYPSFYNSVDRYNGTENDAKVICMRRNYNSKYGSDWMYCLHGTPIKELWID